MCRWKSDGRENQMGDWTRRLRPSVNLTERSTDGFKRQRLSSGPTLDGATDMKKIPAKKKRSGDVLSIDTYSLMGDPEALPEGLARRMVGCTIVKRPWIYGLAETQQRLNTMAWQPTSILRARDGGPLVWTCALPQMSGRWSHMVLSRRSSLGLGVVPYRFGAYLCFSYFAGPP